MKDLFDEATRTEVKAILADLPDAVRLIFFKPREYERIDEKLRQARGERRILLPREDLEYDIVIVGAGPAAYSAAIYATRKGLAVLLLGDNPGGQDSPFCVQL